MWIREPRRKFRIETVKSVAVTMSALSRERSSQNDESIPTRYIPLLNAQQAADSYEEMAYKFRCQLSIERGI